ncbi:hypothetical protein D029_4696 [Vibrio parahaemolyticus 970107]|nr:hypothetical protein D029_4696 [Vibrio parahaemolyticus 970107]
MVKTQIEGRSVSDALQLNVNVIEAYLFLWGYGSAIFD